MTTARCFVALLLGIVVSVPVPVRADEKPDDAKRSKSGEVRIDPVYCSPVSSMTLSGFTGLARRAVITPGTTSKRRSSKIPSVPLRG